MRLFPLKPHAWKLEAYTDGSVVFSHRGLPISRSMTESAYGLLLRSISQVIGLGERQTGRRRSYWLHRLQVWTAPPGTLHATVVLWFENRRRQQEDQEYWEIARHMRRHPTRPLALRGSSVQGLGRRASSSALRDDRHIPQEVKIAVTLRDGGKCRRCPETDHSKLRYDHIIPWSKGGSSKMAANIQLLCVECNSKKSDKVGVW